LLLSGAGIEHIASFEAPKPLQQISPSGKKVTGDSSSQKLAAAEVSSDPLITLVDIVMIELILIMLDLLKWLLT
jgi:hypothetical protein